MPGPRLPGRPSPSAALGVTLFRLRRATNLPELPPYPGQDTGINSAAVTSRLEEDSPRSFST